MGNNSPGKGNWEGVCGAKRSPYYAVFDWFLSKDIKIIPLVGLKVYQWLVRPFRRQQCAHYLAYGGVGCSAYSVETLINMQAHEARNLISNRLASCHEAFDKMNIDSEYKVGCKC